MMAMAIASEIRVASSPYVLGAGPLTGRPYHRGREVGRTDDMYSARRTGSVSTV
jgi:hypothetical protein